jgi:hypothetical protein
VQGNIEPRDRGGAAPGIDRGLLRLQEDQALQQGLFPGEEMLGEGIVSAAAIGRRKGGCGGIRGACMGSPFPAQLVEDLVERPVDQVHEATWSCDGSVAIFKPQERLPLAADGLALGIQR